MKARSIASLVLASAAIVAVASWDGLVESVHYYQPRAYWAPDKPMDFGRVPMRRDYLGWNNEYNRAGNDEEYEPYEQVEAANKRAHEKRVRDLKRALALELKGRHQEARALYQSMSEESDLRSFLRDREEVVRLASGAALRRYLTARWTIEFGEELGTGISAAVRDLGRSKFPGPLRPNVAYALADVGGGGRSERAERFLAVAARFPRSPRAEAALLMAARALIGESDLPRTQTETVRARTLLTRFVAEHPRSVYHASALGWLARSHFLLGSNDAAINAYLAQLRLAQTPVDRWKAYDSIAIVSQTQGLRAREVVVRLKQWAQPVGEERHMWGGRTLRYAFKRLTEDEAAQVQTALRRDASLLGSYVNFRIEGSWMEPADERKLASFATDALRRLSRAPAGVLANVAQINYNSGRYRSAHTLAQRALRARGAAETIHRARYCLAASAARLGRPREAISGYRALLAARPARYLAQSAAEHLALLEERYGDPLKALAIYRELNYDLDIAFLADARLSTAQLERFISTLPAFTKTKPRLEYHHGSGLSLARSRNVFIYALGMRYLRKGDFARAASTFKRLSKQERLDFGLSKAEAKQLSERWWSPDDLPKGRDPLDTVTALWALRKKADRSRGNARAQALYEMAAYQYKNRNLLYYSVSLWKGQRAWSIEEYWNDEVNNDQDEAALIRHCYEHEALRHAAELCREIVRTYPKSPVLPKALYTGALASERLGNMNGWWRERKLPLLRTALAYFARLEREFPKDPLAKPAAKYRREFIAMMSPQW